jgi:hypothetical protein
VSQLLRICLAALTFLAFAIPESLRGQSEQPPLTHTGSIVGTVTDLNGDTVALAQVVLEGPQPDDRRSVVSNERGFFEFHDVQPAVSYHVSVSREGFANWRSPAVTIAPSQCKIVTGIRLLLATEHTTVRVTPSTEKAASEQVKQEEKQRILGVIPNFYVVYGPNFVPLTAKLKFRLAVKTASDPASFLGVAVISGAQQAGDTPAYGQGARGFAKRFGADTAGVFSNIMIGNAILPSLLHQDPRYFYQGVGTNKSRLQRAISSPFVCKGDNGKWQANYSSLGGDLASSLIANAYYPQQNRGAESIFTRFAIHTGARIALSLAQEFVLHKVTHKPGQSE